MQGRLSVAARWFKPVLFEERAATEGRPYIYAGRAWGVCSSVFSHFKSFATQPANLRVTH